MIGGYIEIGLLNMLKIEEQNGNRRGIAISSAENDPQVLGGLAIRFDNSLSYCHVGKNGNLENVVQEMSAVKPDIMLMHMPRVDIIGCAIRLKRQLPDSKIIVLAVGEKGEGCLDSIMNSLLAQPSAPAFSTSNNSAQANEALEKLSPREMEVMILLAKGLIYEEIAESLKVTYATVATHTRHIYKKLRIHSRAKAVAIFHARNPIPH